jgi:dihydroflavonol-4-reductase
MKKSIWSRKNLTIAITGASGHIGANLLQELAKKKNCRIRALVRKDLRALEGLDVECFEGDILDKKSLDRLIKGADIVINLAGRISIVGPEHGLVEMTNVEGTKNVLEACLKHRIKRLLHCSSIHAFASKGFKEIVSEESTLALGAGHMAYDRTKAAAQIEVMKAVRKGLDAVIVNPTGVIGPLDLKISRTGSTLLDIWHGRLPALVNAGFNWVDVRDVAKGILLAIEKGRKGHCYILGGHWAKITDISRIVKELTGRRTVTFGLPLQLAKMVSYFPLFWGKLTGKPAKFTPEAMSALGHHRNVSCDKACKELGYKARPLRETIKDTLGWFRKTGHIS